MDGQIKLKFILALVSIPSSLSKVASVATSGFTLFKENLNLLISLLHQHIQGRFGCPVIWMSRDRTQPIICFYLSQSKNKLPFFSNALIHSKQVQTCHSLDEMR
jgi:hypothetical protein